MKKLYFFFITVFLISSASAQWTSNTLVNTEVSSTVASDAQTQACSDGKTWYVWSKNVPSPLYYEMRAQLLDKNGVKLLGPEGVLVNNVQEASFTTIFSIAVDNFDNLIVGFTSNFNNNIYVNKLNQAGTQIWGATGYVIANSILPRLTVLTNNDVIVSWIDQLVGARGYMQRLASATGTPVWASPVAISPLIAGHATADGHLQPLSNNGFVHVFHDKLTTTGVTSTLWAQRYDANGVAQWAAPVQLSDKGTAYNRFYPTAMNNDTLFLGYMGSTGSRLDCFVQRLNPDGTIPWGLNGSDFATDNTYYEGDINITIAPATNLVWAASLVETTNQNNQGTYVQKFNKQTGLRLLTDNGKVVYPILPAPQVVPFAISLFSDNLPLILLGKYTSFADNKLYATKLDNNGNFVWTGDSIPLCTFVKDKSRVSMTKVVNDQAVAFEVEQKNTFPQPYAQPIRINGSTGLVAPVADFTANNTSVCVGSSVQYTSTSTGYISTYSWTFPGGTPATSTIASPLVTYSTIGVYNASLNVTNSSGTNTNTKSNYINVNGVTPTASLTGNVAGCTGTPTLFTVSGTNLGTNPVYNWTVNGTAVTNTGNTFSYSNTTAGTYVIACSVNSNAACASPATLVTNNISLVLSVPSAPTASLTGNVAGCTGTATLFTVSGTNLGSNPIYNWTVNGTSVTNTGNTFSYSNTTVGTYVIACSVNSSAACVSPSTVVTNNISLVLSLPSAPTASLTGNVAGCTGTATLFTISGTNLGSNPVYNWTVNGTAVTNTGNTFSYSNTIAGTYVIACSVNSSAVCASPSTVVTNNISLLLSAPATPTASISGNISACEGVATTFIATGTNLGTAPTYNWKVNGTTVSNTASTFVYSNIPGTYQISSVITSNANCTSSPTAVSNTINYVVSAFPIISMSNISSTLCKSDSNFILSATPAGGTFTVNGNAATTFSPSLLGVGSYNIVYNINSGCANTASKTVVVSECEIRHLPLDKPGALIILKNPNDGRFGILVKSDILKNLNIRIFNSLGQLVKSMAVGNIYYGTVIPMNITNMASGVYYLNIFNSDNGTTTRKTFRVIKS